jgi:putative aldouronate transport system permease protein
MSESQATLRLRMERSRSEPAKRPAWRGLRRSIATHPWIYVMLVPGIVYFVLFNYLPMFGVVIAFQRFNPFQGVLHSPWIGLENFLRFFRSIYLWRLIRNTLLLNGYGLLIGFPAPIILALMLNEVRDGLFKRGVQTASYLPYFISTVVVASMITGILSPQGGLVNNLVQALGGGAHDYLGDPKWFRHIYVWSDVWQFVGWNSIIYLAALSNIDVALYEAAEIDGAGRFAKMRYISLPGILPVIMIILLLSLGSMLSIGFEKVFMLYSPGTYETADVISTYVYRTGFVGTDYGFGAAVDLFNSVVNLGLLVLFNWGARRMQQQTLW